jgi:hypothetical protein
MPCLQKELVIVQDDPLNFGQFVRPEPAVLCHANERLKPILRHLSITADMHVGWFLPVDREEQETVRTITQRNRHILSTILRNT